MSSAQKNEHTPLMRQYHTIKADYQDAFLFFQVGDFYELFHDDAKAAASLLGIALTKRGKHNGEPIPLCGVPMHAVGNYVSKLVRAGHKVALASQLTEPKPGTIVERAVTQVMTPGTLTDDHLLDEKSASYLCSFFPSENSWGLLFGELMTGQLFATTLPISSERSLESEVVRFLPDEVLVPESKEGRSFQSFFKRLGHFTSVIKSDHDIEPDAQQWMQKQFDTVSVEKLTADSSLHSAVQQFYAYMNKNQRRALKEFSSIHFYEPEDFLILDGPTQRNLELVSNNQNGSRKYTLLSIIDRAVTGMGSRMIKKWLLRPLNRVEAITQRQDVVALLSDDVVLSRSLHQLLTSVGDIERVIGRVALQRALRLDFITLSHVLHTIPALKSMLNNHTTDQHLLLLIISYLGDFSALRTLLDSALETDISSDYTIKDGFDLELDRVRQLVNEGGKQVVDFEARERTKTGINSLKVIFNRVHGYSIEVTNPNLKRVPDYYVRQQTLINKERFTTPELQSIQQELFSARNQIETLEQNLYENLKQDVYKCVPQLRRLAHALAHIDALFGLSRVAYDNGYVRPIFNEHRDISITAGKHPVVSTATDIGTFVPNNTQLTDAESLWIITGPNMGGKSTYLRQVALIQIMAHMGSFVPAKQADLSLLDRIFTRIGSGDNLAQGKSTFLIEMEETASICESATEKSLIIFDEVGRGTSTYDGMAIAQAIIEYLYTKVKARCLFATHYHELNALADQYSGIVNYFLASRKTGQGIIFLHTIVPGVADGSFGVEVAKLAGLPAQIVARSRDLLINFSDKSPLSLPAKSSSVSTTPSDLEEKLAVLADKNRVLAATLSQLKGVDCDNLSPRQAFDLVWDLKKQLDKKTV